MKIATTIGEVYSYVNGSPAEAVRFYEDTGFTHLDYSFYSMAKPDHPFMSDNWKEQVLEAKAAAVEMGFDFVQAHAPCCQFRGPEMEFGLKATIRCIEACGILGIQNVVIHSGCWDGFPYPDARDAYHKENEPFLRALIPAMEANNVHILFENTTIKHTDGNYFPIHGEDMNAFIQFMDHPLFGAAWDVGHAHVDALDQRKEINVMGSNLRALHIHDNNGLRDAHAVPFCGSLDYDNLIQGLIDIEYKGYFTLETGGFVRCNRRKDPSSRLAHSSKEIKQADLRLQYMITKSILDAYGIFEE